MPTDRDMHDFNNRTPGTAYGDYGTWVTDGGPKGPKPPIGPGGGGSRVDPEVLFLVAVSLGAAWAIHFISRISGLVVSPQPMDWLTLIIGWVVVVLLLSFARAWSALPIYVFTSVTLAFIYFGPTTAAIVGPIAFGAAAPWWAPFTRLSDRNPIVGKIVKSLAVLAWLGLGLYLAFLCGLFG